MPSYRSKLPKILWGPSFASTLSIGYPLDNVTAGSEPRAGSVFHQAASGVEDAWVAGLDYELTADVRWIPQTSTSSPLATGWDDGFRSFLEWARQKNVLRFYPDAANVFVFVDCYLVDPMQGYGAFESDGSRKVTLTLRVAPLAIPAFYSLTVGDGTWGSTLSARVVGNFVCSDGVALDLITDSGIGPAYNNAVKPIAAVPATTAPWGARFRVARSGPGICGVSLFDLTAGLHRALVTINFATATPNPGVTAGALVSLVNRGDGSHEVTMNTGPLVVGNAHTIIVYPALPNETDVGSANVGHISVYSSPIGLASFDGY